MLPLLLAATMTPAHAQNTLNGVVAEDDIYDGTRLVGATVEILETGATTTTSSGGVYQFTGLANGTYTVEASLAGYDSATCAKTLDDTETSWWCSIALTVSDDGAGLPDTVDVHATSSLGLKLVNILVGQLAGRLAMVSDGGTRITVEFERSATDRQIE